MKISYKNKTYKFTLGFEQGLTRAAAILGVISICTFLIIQTDKEFFYPIFGFVPSYALGKLMLWQFITAIFLHGSFSHLLFNMLGLYIFGCAIESVFKIKEFVRYFMICGVGSFVFTYFLWLFDIIPNVLCIGASGAIYGLLFAFSMMYPNKKVLLFFAIPMQARWLVIIFGTLEFLLCFRNEGISHFGHLGGLFAGLGYFAYTRGFKFIRKAFYD